MEAEDLVSEATSTQRKRKLVQVFDQLSDTLCRVADMVRFIRLLKMNYKPKIYFSCQRCIIIMFHLYVFLSFSELFGLSRHIIGFYSVIKFIMFAPKGVKHVA